jgi:hypothetical protein
MTPSEPPNPLVTASAITEPRDNVESTLRAIFRDHLRLSLLPGAGEPEGEEELEDSDAEEGGTGTLAERLDRVEGLLTTLLEQRTIKDWYTTAEVAEIVGKAEFTVREWCRLGRLQAQKRRSGRGAFPAWVIAQQELLRFQREGLLPIRKLP